MISENEIITAISNSIPQNVSNIFFINLVSIQWFDKIYLERFQIPIQHPMADGGLLWSKDQGPEDPSSLRYAAAGPALRCPLMGLWH